MKLLEQPQVEEKQVKSDVMMSWWPVWAVVRPSGFAAVLKQLPTPVGNATANCCSHYLFQS